MKRTKQWWSNLTEGERSELTLLEREEKQEDRSDTYIWRNLITGVNDLITGVNLIFYVVPNAKMMIVDTIYRI